MRKNEKALSMQDYAMQAVREKGGDSVTEFNHELIVPNADLPFKLFLFEGGAGNYIRDKHWHRSVEVFAVLEGNLDFYLNEEIHTLTSGTFLLINANEIHSVHAKEKNTTVVLQIPLSVFEPYYTGEQFIRFSHRRHAEDAQVLDVIRRMYQIYERKETGYEMKVMSLYYQLLYYMVTIYRELDVSEDLIKWNRKLERLSKITSYIKEKYTEELSLETLAEIFGYSPAYLSRMFQKYAGINYKTYLQSIRTEYAYRELVNTDHTISEIALRNGFPNSKAFTSSFCRKYGVLPSIYRKQKNGQTTDKTGIP